MSIRAQHIGRCLRAVRVALEALRGESAAGALRRCNELADLLGVRRVYSQTKHGDATTAVRITTQGVSTQFDPRFMVFEFASAMFLRPEQVKLVNEFCESFHADRSMCHQVARYSSSSSSRRLA